MAIKNYYINKDRSVDIYVDNEVFTVPEQTIIDINWDLAKKGLTGVLKEQKEVDDKLIEENNWGPTMHPDYGQEGKKGGVLS